MKQILFSFFVGFFSFTFAQTSPSAFHGHWLSRNYVEALLKTQSPYKIQGKFEAMTEFVFLPELKDSVMINFEDSEGATYPIMFTSATAAYAINAFSKERLDFEIKTVMDTVKVLTCYDSQGQATEYLYFQGKEKAFTGVKNLLNEVLFAGSYRKFMEMNVRTRGLEQVKFYTNGKIEGLVGFDRYEVLTHFDDIANFDVMKLTNSKNKQSLWKGWEIKGNKLIIYDLEKGEEYDYKKAEIFLQLDMEKQVEKN
ncbi:MAG: hypothetical protein ACKVTZ_18560 [Bacteroidia bacterium]